MECLADGLGLPRDTFTVGCVDTESKGDSQSVLRLLHYHSAEGKVFGPDFWRAGPHADFDVLTMVCLDYDSGLHQLFQRDGEGGLEVCPGRKVVGDFGMGQSWLPVEARQDRIVCNIGDQLMRVSERLSLADNSGATIGSSRRTTAFDFRKATRNAVPATLSRSSTRHALM